MIIRTLFHKKMVTHTNILISAQRKALSIYKAKTETTEEEYLQAKQIVEDREVYLKNKVKTHRKICDADDLLIYCTIATLILSFSDFLLGTIITQSISIFVLLYVFLIRKNLARILYMPVLIILYIGLSSDISKYIQ